MSDERSGIGTLTAESMSTGARRRLFWACFVALVATSFAFVMRSFLVAQWQVDFGLSETQKGEIMGAGLWPFGLSIVLFSLVIDRLGYGRSMIFAFACHLVSTLLFVTARGYWALYVGSLLNGLAAGTIEAVINPAIASAYPKQKTKMLTILHAAWPGGLALNGILLLLLGEGGMGVPWQVLVATVLVPVVAYGIMLLAAKFPVSERVAAGVPYRDMLAEAGAVGWLIVIYLVGMEINRLMGLPNMIDTTFFDLPSLPVTILIAVSTVAYLIYTKSTGRWMYVFLLLVMILLAITELGTDAWIKELMGPAMSKFGLSGGWVLVYTATIMTVLRFIVGPIQKLVGSVSKALATPPGFLFLSSLFAAAGLFFLPRAEGGWIVFFATIYGMGQCFFWPLTLGLVSERFPRGGALTLNAVAGVGMLGVGILGSQLLGFWQDTSIDAELREQPGVYGRLMSTGEMTSIFGNYRALNAREVNAIRDKTALYEYRKQVPEGADPGADLAYQTLVRKAYDHLVRTPDDRQEVSFEDMQQALQNAGAFVAGRQYEELAADREVLAEATTRAKRDAMASVAVLPLIMALCYAGLMLYFRSKGGYAEVRLQAAEARGE